MAKFNLDSKFNQSLNALTDLLLLNLMWLLTSLPILTIGASTTALYAVLGRIDRGDGGGIILNYFRYWKREWKLSTVFWLIQIAFTVLLLYNFLSMYNAENPLAQLIGWLSCIAMLILEAIFTLIYPMIARYQNRFGEYLQNAAILFRTNMLRCILQLMLLALPFVMALYLEELFLRTLPVWLLFGVAAVMRGCHLLQRSIFEL